MQSSNAHKLFFPNITYASKYQGIHVNDLESSTPSNYLILDHFFLSKDYIVNVQ